MNKEIRAPWTAHLDGEANFATLLDNKKHWLARIQINGEIHSHFQTGMFNLMAAAPQMYDAIEAADTLCAVLQISDLTPQARSCVREAWPLIQIARAAARPESQYAEAVKESQEHEIKRLDEIIKEREAEIERLREALHSVANQSWSDDEEKLEAADFMRQLARGMVRLPAPYSGCMDPECFYAKSCGHEPGGCQPCKARRQVPAKGIYYGDEI